MSRRLGRFEVSQFFYRDAMKSPDHGANLFHGMFVVAAEAKPWKDTIEYVAVHPDFEPVEFGEEVPAYQAVFPDGEIYPKWRKA